MQFAKDTPTKPNKWPKITSKKIKEGIIDNKWADIKPEKQEKHVTSTIQVRKCHQGEESLYYLLTVIFQSFQNETSKCILGMVEQQQQEGGMRAAELGPELRMSLYRNNHFSLVIMMGSHRAELLSSLFYHFLDKEDDWKDNQN